MLQLLSFVFICLSNVIFQETLLEMDVKNCQCFWILIFKVQIDTKFPFSFKLFFSLLVKKIDIYLHVSEYHSIHSTSLCLLIPCLQASVYDKCVEPLVKSCMEGYNVTIFAYGQTVSTHTCNMCSRQLIYYYSWHLVHTPLLQQSDCVIELPKWAINMLTQRVNGSRCLGMQYKYIQFLW